MRETDNIGYPLSEILDCDADCGLHDRRPPLRNQAEPYLNLPFVRRLHRCSRIISRCPSRGIGPNRFRAAFLIQRHEWATASIVFSFISAADRQRRAGVIGDIRFTSCYAIRSRDGRLGIGNVALIQMRLSASCPFHYWHFHVPGVASNKIGKVPFPMVERRRKLRLFCARG